MNQISAISNDGRARRVAALAALIAFQGGAIAVLHRLGGVEWMTIPWDRIGPWLDIAPLEDVVAAVVRAVALLVAYWIAVSTALYLLARLSRVAGLVRATAWATLPPIRRVIDRAIAVTITTAALSAPIAPALAADIAGAPPATPEPIVFQISDQGVPTPLELPAGSPTVLLPPGVGGAGYTPNPAGGVAAGAPATTDPTQYEVVNGDNLWTISARHLAAANPERDVDAAEIGRYWRRVIEINTQTLRSGNPNLIFPGELVVLPAIEPGGSA